MMEKIKFGFVHMLFGGAILTFLLFSCKKILDVGTPVNKVTGSDAFMNDSMATATVSSIYTLGNAMGMKGIFFGLLNGGATACGGLMSDEFLTASNDQEMQQLAFNSISPFNGTVANLWSNGYSIIYMANASIEGISNSKTISSTTATLLLGECKFIRAFTYFYLTNFFGDVPLVTHTDYMINAVLPRTPVAKIYDQIVADLKDAQLLLTDKILQTFRPGKYAAAALLSRVYLYRKEYALAESEAGKLIGSGQFSLTSNPGNVFLTGSTEGIWQIPLPSGAVAFPEAFNFLVGPNTVTPNYYLRGGLPDAFSNSDLRKTAWIRQTVAGGNSFLFPGKYRKSPADQYVMLRLAEQFLIRAEARVRQHRVADAIPDVDSVRKRAGLDLLSVSNPGIDEAGLLSEIELQNRLEFCTEWGHRWFDLRRLPGITNPSVTRADEVLGQIKPGWKPEDLLLPIPDIELQKNRNLVQNPSY